MRHEESIRNNALSPSSDESAIPEEEQQSPASPIQDEENAARTGEVETSSPHAEGEAASPETPQENEVPNASGKELQDEESPASEADSSIQSLDKEDDDGEDAVQTDDSLNILDDLSSDPFSFLPSSNSSKIRLHRHHKGDSHKKHSQHKQHHHHHHHHHFRRHHHLSTPSVIRSPVRSPFPSPGRRNPSPYSPLPDECSSSTHSSSDRSYRRSNSSSSSGSLRSPSLSCSTCTSKRGSGTFSSTSPISPIDRRTHESPSPRSPHDAYETEKVEESNYTYDIPRHSRHRRNEIRDMIAADVDELAEEDESDTVSTDSSTSNVGSTPISRTSTTTTTPGSHRRRSRRKRKRSPSVSSSSSSTGSDRDYVDSGDNITYGISATDADNHSQLRSESSFDLVTALPKVKRKEYAGGKKGNLPRTRSLNDLDMAAEEILFKQHSHSRPVRKGKSEKKKQSVGDFYVRDVQTQTLKSAILDRSLRTHLFTRLTITEVLRKEVKSMLSRITITIFVIILLLITILILSLPICSFEKQHEEDVNGSVEMWTYGNCVYFAIVTLLTIGLGDMTPVTTGGRLYLVFFGIFGLSLVLTFIGLVGREVIYIADHFLNLLAYTTRRTTHSVEDAIFGPDQGPYLFKKVTHWMAKILLSPTAKIIYMLILSFIYFLLGAIYFSYSEDLNYADALYFCFIVLSTIGYGDIVPVTEASKIFLVFYCIGGLGVVTILIGFIGEGMLHSIESQRLRIKRTIIRRTKITTEKKERQLVFVDDSRWHNIQPSVITLKRVKHHHNHHHHHHRPHSGLHHHRGSHESSSSSLDQKDTEPIRHSSASSVSHSSRGETSPRSSRSMRENETDHTSTHGDTRRSSRTSSRTTPYSVSSSRCSSCSSASSDSNSAYKHISPTYAGAEAVSGGTEFRDEKAERLV